MIKYYKDGAEFDINRMHVFDDVQYPAGWFADPANRDAMGITEQEVEDVPVQYVPPSVTMRQARLALLAAGKLADVETAINSLPSPTKEAARIEWDYSSAVVRARPLVGMIGAALGMDEAALDQLFITAAGL
jgi:hypothetical protein